MHAHRDLLALAGTHLAGVPTAAIEWSLQVSGRGAVARDRLLFWTGSADAFARIGALLRELGAPSELLEVQSRLAPHSIRQGLGLGGADVSFYVHHFEGGAEHCDAWKWSDDEPPRHSFYEAHYLPCTPAGTAPVDLIHEELRPLWRRLASDARVQTSSGFWLRHQPLPLAPLAGRGCRAAAGEGPLIRPSATFSPRGGEKGHTPTRIDQISLTYPWQPAVAEVMPAIGIDALQPWRDHHFRHIAMSSPHAAEPSLTFYFTGAMHGGWPVDAEQARERVRESARATHAAIEARVFARLPREPRLTSIGGDAVDDETLIPQLARLIRRDASVYLIGCGRGSIATFLTRTHGCRVVGLTADREEHAHGSRLGLRTRYGRPEETLPPGRFDSIVVLDGKVDLETLRVFGDRIVVRAGTTLTDIASSSTTS